MSFVNQRSATAVASGPRSSHFWSGDSSHTPQARRTASCSRIASPNPATQLQPSHSANSAPGRARCTESNGVAVSVCSPLPTGRPVYASGVVRHNTTRATDWTTSRAPPGGGRACDARARRLPRRPVRGGHERARRAAPASTPARCRGCSRPLSTVATSSTCRRRAATGWGRICCRLANHVSGRLDLRAQAHPHLEALESATGETATLSIPGDAEAVTVDFVASRASVASVARVGRPSVAHATATGKVMLAFARRPAPPVELEALHRPHDRRCQAAAAGDRRGAPQGYAQAVKEREADLNALAAPIFGAARRAGRDPRLAGAVRRVSGARRATPRCPRCSSMPLHFRQGSGTMSARSEMALP